MLTRLPLLLLYHCIHYERILSPLQVRAVMINSISILWLLFKIKFSCSTSYAYLQGPIVLPAADLTVPAHVILTKPYFVSVDNPFQTKIILSIPLPNNSMELPSSLWFHINVIFSFKVDLGMQTDLSTFQEHGNAMGVKMWF